MNICRDQRFSSVCLLNLWTVIALYSCIEPVVYVSGDDEMAINGTGESTLPTSSDPYGDTEFIEAGHEEIDLRDSEHEMSNGSGGMGPVVMNPTSCTPGTSLGVCIECAPGNTRRVPTQDDQCEPIDCGSLTSHRLVSSEGRVECRKQEFLPGPSMCQGENACFTNPEDYCSDRSEEELVMSSDDIEECQELSGCDDQQEPEVVIAAGASCRHGMGMCDDTGACIILSCDLLFNWRYNNDNRLCADQLDQGYCEFLVNSDNNPWNVGEQTNCNEFCTAMGGHCLNAWHEDSNSCRKNDTQSCENRFNDSICRCAPAS